ncbi:MAG TPA: malate synthase G [Pseudolysinimonas sp.]|nr:malate synthase G [Pseudolysinimonas sp.]
MTRLDRAGLSVDSELVSFLEEEVLPTTGLAAGAFWHGAESVIAEFGPAVAAALARREHLQREIDAWHRAHPGPIDDAGAYTTFLRSIGYLLDEPATVSITTEDVDTEIARQAGPQLVVPLTNPRFAANAANARWGSLYDALYGTDVISRGGELAPGEGYNPVRGAAVVGWARQFLDAAVPPRVGSHADVTGYTVADGALLIGLSDGTTTSLADPSAFAGYQGDPAAPTSVLFVHHRLHVELVIDRAHPIGASDPAGIRDVILESAVTTIMDLEDSVSAVDAADKIVAYRTWLLLMQGSLATAVEKDGERFTRTLATDREYADPHGGRLVLHGRSLLFVRHVGHSMFTDAVLDRDGREVPEGVLDALVTAAAAMHSLRDNPARLNSRTGSMYVVKPKQHGPDEVALTVRLFAAVEAALGLPDRTLKLGIMDEERRTTVNLAACVDAARDRVVFINTGFLDRTGDEIHTSMQAGAFLRKGDLKSHPFLGAYEDHNVDVGLAAGFAEHAQIGKGMWAMTELMRAMLEQKIAQPRAGASTAWVPSPTAATLHATHYHRVDVAAAQRQLTERVRRGIGPILEIPVARDASWSDDERHAELDNNVQSILGYVVRWVDQGIGCSKVPDLSDTALMEDRATLRISSQLLGNWLLHGVISADEVLASMDRIAPAVDRQNAGDPAYRAIGSATAPSLAYQAARDLILNAASQPSGYTEPILHSYRRRRKAES